MGIGITILLLKVLFMIMGVGIFTAMIVKNNRWAVLGWFCALLWCYSTILLTPAYGRSEGTLGQISDTLCVATPVVATVSSLAKEDLAGTGLFLVQFGSQELFVHGMKEALSNTSMGERPNDKDKEGESRGFISSHVSSTAAGAIKLWRLYPDNYWVKGLSSLAVATVGYQRIQGKHHSELQVGLGVATAFLFDYIGQKVSKRLRISLVENGVEGMLTWNF